LKTSFNPKPCLRLFIKLGLSMLFFSQQKERYLFANSPVSMEKKHSVWYTEIISIPFSAMCQG
jgi:hypothetical protein